MPTFTPSSAQLRLLDYIHDHPVAQSTLAVCKDSGVPRATYYRWCRDPTFRAWIGSAWSSRLLLDGISLIN